MLRKKNKLPADTHSVDFELEYGKATIEVHKDSINHGEAVLIIDDLIATGGTAEAAAKLIDFSKGSVAGFIFVINLFDLSGSDKLINLGYKVENLINFLVINIQLCKKFFPIMELNIPKKLYLFKLYSSLFEIVL